MENATQTGAETSAEPQDLVSVFADLIDGKELKEAANAEVEAGETPSDETEAEAKQDIDDEPLVTVKINGQEMQIKQSELIASYQKDSSAQKKFEEAAQLRKSADAETAKARQERAGYAQQLNQYQQQLAYLQNQPINWQQLIDNDPVEYLRQRQAHEERQGQLNQVQAAQHQLNQQMQHEHRESQERHLMTEAESLVSKVPEWKDPAKSATEKAAIAQYLLSSGYGEQDIGGLNDHRAVILARKAMLYDQLIGKASVASKKVQALPAKVERPGTGDSNKPDARSESMKRLGRTGRIEDAANVFASFL